MVGGAANLLCNKVGRGRDAPKGLIQRRGAGVTCGRSRGQEVSVDISPHDRGRTGRQVGARIRRLICEEAA